MTTAHLTKAEIETLDYFKGCVVALRCTLADLKLGGLEHAELERQIGQLELHIKFIENPPVTEEDRMTARVLRAGNLLI